MDFQESLDYLYGLQLFGVKLGLENMQALKKRLPALQEPLSCIHVAGTNGKGSVSVMLAEILRHAGLHVGLYTSPHLHCFSERIQIDGTPISRADIARLAGIVRGAATNIPATFFEATTAMALLAFKERQVDIAVIETGLGGRLDATNIVEPRLSLITPVSYDHREHLGNSLAEIAAEKAGIIKAGVPVVVGRQEPVAAELLMAVAAQREAEVLLAGRDYSWLGRHDDFTVAVGATSIEGLSCCLAGRHQQDNFAQAVAAVYMLRRQGFSIDDDAIRLAGQSVVWPGRLEWWGPERCLLADVSHNRAGTACLADYLAMQNISRIHLVCGLSGMRNPAEVLKPLEKIAIEVYAVPIACDQSVPVSLISGWAEDLGLPSSEYATAFDGLSSALVKADHRAPVVVCGSLYLVAELRQKFMEGKAAIHS